MHTIQMILGQYVKRTMWIANRTWLKKDLSLVAFQGGETPHGKWLSDPEGN